ncbi:MAG: hypothetical protein OXJ52_01815 [Oligoflexia bacterium]|nr:hypothetical protein [Oligoflexia bacterium]
MEKNTNYQNCLKLKYNIVPSNIHSREILEIPEDALREALVNAVTYRERGLCRC